MPPKLTWDAELYEARHGFVWQLGEALVDMLDPKPGERVLDLGCGPGHLTQKIAERGAQVVGLDASPEMIGLARQNYPGLQFVLQDAARMHFDAPFDAVFSNAALHWMLDAAGVASAIYRALRSGGRFVAEMGGKGNILRIESAVEQVMRPYLGSHMPEPRTFFPSIPEYAAILERSGLEVHFARLFDRPTQLEGENGIETWLRQFKGYYFEGLPPQERECALSRIIEQLRPALYQNGRWMADYRRLQVIAVKSAHPRSHRG